MVAAASADLQATCSSSGTQVVSIRCKTCESGAYLVDGRCAPCSTNCATCNNAISCASCKYGFYNVSERAQLDLS